jgi:hypothetical protein
VGRCICCPDELHSAIWRIIRAPISPTAFLDRVRLSLNFQGASDLPSLDGAAFHEEELLAQLAKERRGAGAEGAGMTTRPDIDEASLAIGRCRTLLDLAEAKMNSIVSRSNVKADAVWTYVDSEMRRHLADIDRALGLEPPEDRDQDEHDEAA